jgi:hypothetical protein
MSVLFISLGLLLPHTSRILPVSNSCIIPYTLIMLRRMIV